MAETICILSGIKAATIAAGAFSLAWIHSVEKIAWQEDWVVENGALRIVEARVKGSGAGMEPPEGAILKDGWWRYTPKLPPQHQINLAASGATVGGWTFCAAGRCRELGLEAGAGITISVCDPDRP